MSGFYCGGKNKKNDACGHKVKAKGLYCRHHQKQYPCPVCLEECESIEDLERRLKGDRAIEKHSINCEKCSSWTHKICAKFPIDYDMENVDEFFCKMCEDSTHKTTFRKSPEEFHSETHKKKQALCKCLLLCNAGVVHPSNRACISENSKMKRHNYNLDDPLDEVRRDYAQLEKFLSTDAECEMIGSLYSSGIISQEITGIQILGSISNFFKSVEASVYLIFYEGHGVTGTGDWCFGGEGKEAYVEIRQILECWSDARKIDDPNGEKKLLIFSDSCYSGKLVDYLKTTWTKKHTKPYHKNILIQASCSSDQVASDGCFTKMWVDFNREVFQISKSATSNQTKEYRAEYRVMLGEQNPCFYYYLQGTKRNPSEKINVSETKQLTFLNDHYFPPKVGYGPGPG